MGFQIYIVCEYINIAYVSICTFTIHMGESERKRKKLKDYLEISRGNFYIFYANITYLKRYPKVFKIHLEYI